MKRPSIKAAKEYFKDAKTIQVCNASTIIEVNPDSFKISDVGGINEVLNGEYLITNSDYHCVFCTRTGYAKIITTK